MEGGRAVPDPVSANANIVVPTHEPLSTLLGPNIPPISVTTKPAAPPKSNILDFDMVYTSFILLTCEDRASATTEHSRFNYSTTTS